MTKAAGTESFGAQLAEAEARRGGTVPRAAYDALRQRFALRRAGKAGWRCGVAWYHSLGVDRASKVFDPIHFERWRDLS